MATKGIHVRSLDVGQGMCTFVEVYNDQDKLIRTLLFDLGSSKASNKVTVQFIANQIKARQPSAYLDAVFISHKDSDHVSALPELLDLIPNVGIGMVRYGGRRSWYTKSGGKNIINRLAERCANPNTDVTGFSVGDTNYDPDLGFFEYLWDMDDVTIYLIAVNTPYGSEKVGAAEDIISTRPDGDQANSKSLVCYIWYKANGFTISGDATFPTMGYINGVLKGQKLPHTAMILLPHHGSRKTTFGLPKTSAEISDEAYQVVKTFARKMAAKTVVASANTKHSHPSLETSDVFEAYTDQAVTWWVDPALDNGTHYVTMFQDVSLGDDSPLPGKYRSWLTEENVYSTLYKGAEIAVDWIYPPGVAYTAPTPPILSPSGVNYLYTISANGNVELYGEPSGRTSTVEEVLFGENRQPPPRGAPAPPPSPAPSPIRPALTAAQQRSASALTPLSRLKGAW